MTQRIIYGLIAMLLTGLIMEFLPNPYGAYGGPDSFFYFALWPATWMCIEIGFSAFVGAYVANVRFVIPAILYIVVVAIVSLFIVQRIGEPLEPPPTGEIVGRNSINFIIALGAAIIGAKLGTWTASMRRQPVRA